MTKMSTIDWDFIANHEGKSLTTGYVPNVGTSKSGVTIATGVDLGQRNHSEIVKWNLTPDLTEKLRSYCGMCGNEAVALLKSKPLTVTAEEADALDKAAAEEIFGVLQRNFDVATHQGAFDALPRAVRTVLASLAYQYGPNLQRRTPKFWHVATEKNWPGVIHELENFGDAYSKRRQDEARYLKAALDKNFDVA
ncbi:pesticin C-terminus-like muramidase [Govanella unica]|uniref:Pesticin C-terminus-like muramidase n=1 Tax=Govanella unica TaxID=2975056 RepID=A0A9X3TX00_9PROT|nr:pesticin C-terminus-like muramidase [Govania unica]MDA5193178.1 pesticin C-terminus-like muramidase [Govania unica]